MSNTSFNIFDSLVFLTSRVSRLMSNSIRNSAGDESIRLLPTHMGVLVDLWKQDGLRQQDLVVSAIKDKATIARAIDNMESENILVRVPDPNDKRYKRIYLTHKGKSLQGHMTPHIKIVETSAVEEITEEELQICKKVLRTVYNRLRN